MRNYTEQYEYDEVGNFIALHHLARGSTWNRDYFYQRPQAESLLEPGKVNNRLTHSEASGFPETYTYDEHGNMTAINSMAMTWDFKDQLQQVDLGGGGTAYYVYAASGQRVRKVIETQNGTRKQERIYLGGFEVYREFNSNGTAEELKRESLHIMDDKQRIALVETKTVESGISINAPKPLQRYQLGNHLGSASVELNESGALISYEEYYSYGTTAFQTGRSAAEASLKRYRYIAKERDEETGFYFHGARYYLAWLGRWSSTDPAGLIDGVNLYVYTKSSPTRYTDKSGRQSTSSVDEQSQQSTPRVEGIPKEHVNLLGSRYGLSFIDVGQWWPEHSGRTVLNLIASNFTPLTALSSAVAIEALLDDLGSFLPSIKRADIARIDFQPHTDEPLFMNTVGAWRFRPTAKTEAENLYLAGDYCRSHIDLVSMEGAVTTGLMAAEAVRADLRLARPVEILQPKVYPRALLWLLWLLGLPVAALFKLIAWIKRGDEGSLEPLKQQLREREAATPKQR